LEIAEVTRTTAAAATVVRLAVRLTHRVRVLAQVTALNFPLPIFLSRKKQPRQRQLVNASGRIVGTARLIVAFREPRERYQEGDAKVVAAGFIFALETLGF
jgi:hypothetical protein